MFNLPHAAQTVADFIWRDASTKQSKKDKSVWEQIRAGFQDAEAGQAIAYLIAREPAPVARYDVNTPTTVNRVTPLTHVALMRFRPLLYCSMKASAQTRISSSWAWCSRVAVVTLL